MVDIQSTPAYFKAVIGMMVERAPHAKESKLNEQKRDLNAALNIHTKWLNILTKYNANI